MRRFFSLSFAAMPLPASTAILSAPIPVAPPPAPVDISTERLSDIARALASAFRAAREHSAAQRR